jgi:hypothetical protein
MGRGELIGTGDRIGGGLLIGAGGVTGRGPPKGASGGTGRFGSKKGMAKCSSIVQGGGKRRCGMAPASLSIWMFRVSRVYLFLLLSGDQFLKVSAPIFVGRVFE